MSNWQDRRGLMHQRVMAALASSSLLCRRMRTLVPLSLARRFKRRVAVISSVLGWPSTCRMTAARSVHLAASSAAHKACFTLSGVTMTRRSGSKPRLARPCGNRLILLVSAKGADIHKTGFAACWFIRLSKAIANPVKAPASRLCAQRISCRLPGGRPVSKKADNSSSATLWLLGSKRLAGISCAFSAAGNLVPTFV